MQFVFVMEVSKFLVIGEEVVWVCAVDRYVGTTYISSILLATKIIGEYHHRHHNNHPFDTSNFHPPQFITHR